MTVDDYQFLAQVIPVFLLVVLLEDIFDPRSGGTSATPGLTKTNNSVDVLYRSGLIGGLGLAEVYAVLRGLDRLPASQDWDTFVLVALVLAVVVVILWTTLKRWEKELFWAHAVGMLLVVAASAGCILLLHAAT